VSKWYGINVFAATRYLRKGKSKFPAGKAKGFAKWFIYLNTLSIFQNMGLARRQEDVI
jgi:hypothetical protein